ncbi:GNAT family N-acetyltransferase [Deinococcus sp. AJ005]|uniref:GNAT family N-acetyltransferase n=1 Tax=Deinococcus sp. AJ005 TaxID=2652443 RepID=UPI00125CB498|nr:GNAT family N-acetyltransferase [Deinococcus sp. AJ005]QFP75911.1 GNAT family N-acetyltransferase [Deinococcus sp. AJ005]
MSEPHIRLLTGADAAVYREVRLAALRSDPNAFITTAAEFESRTLESITAQLTPQPTFVTFGAFVGNELVGLLSLGREERPRLKHRANIFGVSVSPAARGQGCADALMRAGLAHARGWDGVTSIHLSVTETQTAARCLYERYGFQVWGTQPDAVQDDEGHALTEHHLCLLLDGKTTSQYKGQRRTLKENPALTFENVGARDGT